MKNKNKKKGCLTAVIISLVVAGIIGSCGTDGSETSTTNAITEEYITEEVTTAPPVSEAFATTEAETTAQTQTTTEKETTTQKQTTTQKETTSEKKTATTQKATATTKKAATTQKETATKKITTTKKPVATTAKKASTTKKVTTTKKKAETTKANIGSEERLYVLNTNTKKFHYPSCSSVKKIKAENYSEFEGTREAVVKKGFEPCGNCHP